MNRGLRDSLGGWGMGAATHLDAAAVLWPIDSVTYDSPGPYACAADLGRMTDPRSRAGSFRGPGPGDGIGTEKDLARATAAARAPNSGLAGHETPRRTPR